MFLYRLATAIAEKVIFLNCDDIADFHRFHMLPKNSKKALLLPSEGVDIEFYSRQNFGTIVEDAGVEREPSKQPQIVLIFIGRLLIDKGIREYLQAARKVRQKYPFAKFQVLGPIDDGNPSTIKPSELKSYIESGEIEYLGSVSDVRPYISNADALVLPTSYGEGFSRVCLEALSMGVPVISSDNRGCKNAVIHHLTGLTFPSLEMHLLPDVIEEFINLPKEKRRDLGVNGQKLVTERYTTKHVQEHYITLIPEEAN
jgi:glycosyltransferase involved in cell wall biosynthesis